MRVFADCSVSRVDGRFLRNFWRDTLQSGWNVVPFASIKTFGGPDTLIAERFFAPRSITFHCIVFWFCDDYTQQYMVPSIQVMSSGRICKRALFEIFLIFQMLIRATSFCIFRCNFTIDLDADDFKMVTVTFYFCWKKNFRHFRSLRDWRTRFGSDIRTYGFSSNNAACSRSCNEVISCPLQLILWWGGQTFAALKWASLKCGFLMNLKTAWFL